MKSSALMNVGVWVGLCAVLLAPASAAVAAAATEGARPVIEVPETSKDGGVVEEGTLVPFQFTVTNRGQADLKIAQVKPSCGCTVTQWDPVVQPGAQGIIKAQMSTDYFRNFVTKHLTIFSNDAGRPQVDLTISAHVLPLVQISPGPDALLVMKDKAVTQAFTLERSGGHPMKIIQVIPNAPYIKAQAAPLPGTGRYQLSVTALPDAPLGRSSVPVVVWTDVPKSESMTFIITVERGIVTVPPMLFFGILPHEMKTPRQATVTIQRSANPFHVKSLTVDDPHLAPKLETVRDGAEYRVTVTYAGGWDTTGVRRQRLTVTTDDPTQPVIEIPVQAFIQAQNAPAPSAVNR